MIPDDIEMVREAGIRVGPLHPIDTGRPGVCSCHLGDRCEHPGKHPILTHGVNDFSADRATVERWVRRYPGCNWGGRPDDSAFVLDVDPRHGGDESLSRLELDRGPLPPTLTARTGGGGWHFWFTGTARLGKMGDRYPGLDVKTSRGYLVLPPSVHASGQAYTWLDLRPAEHAPAWMLDMLDPPVKTVRVGTHIHPLGLIRYVTNATTNRNNALFWASCRVAEQGGDPRILREAAVSCGLDLPEIEKTIESATRTYGMATSLCARAQGDQAATRTYGMVK